MLVLSRRRQESVVVGAAELEPMLKVTVLRNHWPDMCAWASRPAKRFLSIAGKCGNESAPSARRTTRAGIQRRLSDEAACDEWIFAPEDALRTPGGR